MRLAKLVLFIAALMLAACAPSGTGGATPDVIPEGPDMTSAPEMTEPAGEGEVMDELAGTEWTLSSIDLAGESMAIVGATNPTLEFQSSGEVVGEGGCNSFGGQYQITGNAVIFSDITSTLIACEDQEVMDQETMFLNALESADSFELSGDTLIISYNGGDALRFVRFS